LLRPCFSRFAVLLILTTLELAAHGSAQQVEGIGPVRYRVGVRTVLEGHALLIAAFGQRCILVRRKQLVTAGALVRYVLLLKFDCETSQHQ
jgi:hypothetical protein